MNVEYRMLNWFISVDMEQDHNWAVEHRKTPKKPSKTLKEGFEAKHGC